jgi:ankyrin repeat protein|eukprot:82187_1
MGAASSLFKLAESDKWDEVENFLLDKDIANETKIENLRYRDKYRGSPLHSAIYRKAPVYIIVLMVDIGGDDLLTKIDHDGSNALHHAAISGSSNDILTLMTRIGEQQILTERDSKGKIPLYYSIDRFGKPSLRAFKCFMREGLLQNIGGEYGMGGIFIKDRCGNSTLDLLFERMSCWVTVELINEVARGRPLLHGAICNVSLETLKKIINKFPWSVSSQDRNGRLPIHVAAETNLTWQNGMKDLVQANEGSIEAADSKVTGLYPFALAAAGKSSDLNTVYNLIHRRVNLLFTK